MAVISTHHPQPVNVDAGRTESNDSHPDLQLPLRLAAEEPVTAMPPVLPPPNSAIPAAMQELLSGEANMKVQAALQADGPMEVAVSLKDDELMNVVIRRSASGEISMHITPKDGESEFLPSFRISTDRNGSLSYSRTEYDGLRTDASNAEEFEKLLFPNGRRSGPPLVL